LDGDDQSVSIPERLLERLYAQIRLFQSIVNDRSIQGWHISTTRHQFEFLQYFACPVVVSSRTVHVPQKSLAKSDGAANANALLVRRDCLCVHPFLFVRRAKGNIAECYRGIYIDGGVGLLNTPIELACGYEYPSQSRIHD